MTRIAGCTIPLFSLRTRRSWGIGQISDLVPTAAWLKTGGMRLLQILPPYELSDGETSPYGARTAFGLDPVYIDLDAVEDLGPGGAESVLDDGERRELERLRASPRVDYDAVRVLKRGVLQKAFRNFYEREWREDSPRAFELRAFIAREAAWEDDLALYVTLREAYGSLGWEHWPDMEASAHEPKALDQRKKEHAERVLEHQYGQWLAHQQWQKAREGLAALGVELMGDLPFIVGHESADVWGHMIQFRNDVTLGAPPDAFSPEGQNWNLPVYDWEVMDDDHLAWIVARTRHAARLYDRFRLDHVVGYFRMYVTPVRRDKNENERANEGEAATTTEGDGAREKGFFYPDGETAQRARGHRLLKTMVDAAEPARIIAEDLGIIPDFVREVLEELDIPGYRVIPWERDYVRHVYRTPNQFPRRSVASWSTHDTAPISSWWRELQGWEREGLSQLAGIELGAGDDERWIGLMSTLLHARSDLTLVLGSEVVGDGLRINTPGLVSPENWTYRLPMAVEDLERDPGIQRRMEALRAMAKSSGRTE
ncbi:4-alpha-glucanotransferase [Pendulispora albinea]|uniref:4-alpha-glucanotransferase n=1 Tax=Pendulispora albinea TaxID=2741071 RepID=A0ABZ2M6C4_9BACT